MAMTEQAFLVLTALAGGPQHGYGLIGEVEKLSAGAVRLRVGTLYGVLDRFSGDGLVEPDREEVVSGRLRRYYRITDDGRRALAADAARQEAAARLATERLRGFRIDPEGAA
jgi:PadR family transcriptional regulator PadR